MEGGTPIVESANRIRGTYSSLGTGVRVRERGGQTQGRGTREESEGEGRRDGDGNCLALRRTWERSLCASQRKERVSQTVRLGARKLSRARPPAAKQGSPPRKVSDKRQLAKVDKMGANSERSECSALGIDMCGKMGNRKHLLIIIKKGARERASVRFAPRAGARCVARKATGWTERGD